MAHADQDQRDSQSSTPAEPSPKGKSAAKRRRQKARLPLRKQATSSPLQTSRTPDYLIIGHITADLMDSGEVVLGGTALYSAIPAARLGANVAILTRGAFGREIAGMKVPGLEEFAGNIQIIVQDADVPTTFVNEYQATRRVQTIKHWAGPIDLRGLPPHWRNARVVHLGPVADEIDRRNVAGMTTGFLGVTPQGWMRDWPRTRGGRVRDIPLRLPPELIGRIDCAIVSDEEIFQAREVIERVAERRLSVVTRGPAGARIYYSHKDDEGTRQPGARQFQTLDIPGIDVKVESLTGAGDVFAAAFFLKAADKTVSAKEAGRFANVIAALSLREMGVGTVPSLAEVEEYLANS